MNYGNCKHKSTFHNLKRQHERKLESSNELNRSRKEVSSNMYSPRSIYTTVGRRKSRNPIDYENPLYNTEVNTSQTNINDLNDSYLFNTTLPNNINFSTARATRA